MASKRDLWEQSFLYENIPGFPCPACDRGIMAVSNGSFTVTETTPSARRRQKERVKPQDVEHRFIMLLECSVEDCKELMSVHGDAALYERNYREHRTQAPSLLLKPKGMNPAPPLASIPAETPAAVARDIKIAFRLFWVDLGACANRLRIAVERILDAMEVKDGKLVDRINAFEEREPEHAGTFDALRYVGNVGSHEGDVERVAVLDAFELLQEAIAELFGRRSAKINEMRQRLIKSKGRY